MATYAKILKDPMGNQILPYTRSKLVYMNDGYTVEDAINNIQNQGGYTLPTASAYTLGGVKIGNNIDINNGTISVPTGSYYSSGVLSVGDNINVSYGQISLTKDNVTNALGYVPPETSVTYNNFTGATSYTSGQSGLVPGPDINNREYRKYLCDNGKWESLAEGGWYFDDYVIKNTNGYIRAGSIKKYHVHINGNMVHVVFNFLLNKDAIAHSMSNTIFFTMENMPSIWEEGSNYKTGSDIIGTVYGTDASGMRLSFSTIQNTTVSNASNYRFKNGINIYITTSYTYPAGNGIVGQFTYYSNSIV